MYSTSAAILMCGLFFNQTLLYIAFFGMCMCYYFTTSHPFKGTVLLDFYFSFFLNKTTFSGSIEVTQKKITFFLNFLQTYSNLTPTSWCKYQWDIKTRQWHKCTYTLHDSPMWRIPGSQGVILRFSPNFKRLPLALNRQSLKNRQVFIITSQWNLLKV